MSEWIDFKEIKPEKGISVIATDGKKIVIAESRIGVFCNDGDKLFVGTFGGDSVLRFISGPSTYDVYICPTHWMALPVLPVIKE